MSSSHEWLELEVAYEAGAAVAFGLMGMAEAIRALHYAPQPFRERHVRCTLFGRYGVITGVYQHASDCAFPEEHRPSASDHLNGLTWAPQRHSEEPPR